MKLLKRSVCIIMAVVMCLLLASCFAEGREEWKGSSGTAVSTSAVDQASSSAQKPAVDEAKIKTVTTPCYNLSYSHYSSNDDAFYNDDKPVSTFKTGDYTFLYIEGEEEILYTTIENYTSMLSGDLMEDFTSETVNEGEKSTYRLTYNGDKEIEGVEKGVVCEVTFDAASETIYGKGSLNGAFKDGDIYKSTVVEHVSIKTEHVAGKDNTFENSFSGYGFNSFVYQGGVYFPFSVVDFKFQQSSGRYFAYAQYYNMMFEYSEEEQKDVGFTLTGVEDFTESVTIKNVVEKSYEKKYLVASDTFSSKVAPEYMVEYTKNLFIFAMDYYYGLASTLGYKSMKDYFENTTYYDDFTSTDPKKRASAYGKALSLLNDMHTGMTLNAVFDESTGLLGARYAQTFTDFHLFLSRTMKEQREAEIKKSGVEVGDGSEKVVRYSSDGKTAYFSFDEFMGTKYDSNNVTFEKDTVKFFIRNLNEIRNHGRAEGAEKGTVENVVIDESLNGGGYVYVMLKLLALISKDNKSIIYIKDEATGRITKYNTRIDSNEDGVFDENDCFGQYFKFFILTSPISFSCGNAFPYYAKKMGIATVIGAKTGGGECIVGKLVFPLGQYIQMSSMMHVGWYDEEKGVFEGVEEGASPAKGYSGNYYNVDNVAESISKISV
ncbi:MAG: hypothetical protein J5762_02510 [Clostridia bacterium]|nr:hypothetical protein [Clostridia bacterium]